MKDTIGIIFVFHKILDAGFGQPISEQTEYPSPNSFEGIKNIRLYPGLRFPNVFHSHSRPHTILQDLKLPDQHPGRKTVSNCILDALPNTSKDTMCGDTRENFTYPFSVQSSSRLPCGGWADIVLDLPLLPQTV